LVVVVLPQPFDSNTKTRMNLSDRKTPMSELSEDELLAIVAGTRNNRRKPPEKKAKKPKKAKSKVITAGTASQQGAQGMTPEEAKEMLRKLGVEG